MARATRGVTRSRRKDWPEAWAVVVVLRDGERLYYGIDHAACELHRGALWHQQPTHAERFPTEAAARARAAAMVTNSRAVAYEVEDVSKR